MSCTHHFHFVENGEVKTSAPPWYQVKCCQCGEGNYMRTETIRCYTPHYKGLGSAAVGELLYKPQVLKEKQVGSIIVVEMADE
jgi:hypothetical protein